VDFHELVMENIWNSMDITDVLIIYAAKLDINHGNP